MQHMAEPGSAASVSTSLMPVVDEYAPTVELFETWLRSHFPNMADAVVHHVLGEHERMQEDSAVAGIGPQH